MAIEISEYDRQPSIGKTIWGTVVTTAGQRLKLESSPDGEEFANVGPVPEGKKWTAHVRIDIVESNA